MSYGPGIEDIRKVLEGVPPGRSLQISKKSMPTLPAEFVRTSLGTPNWLAHPGASAQYRAKTAMHAYEMTDRWDFHRDHYDPQENPLGHFFVDAPELPLALFAAAIAGIATYLYLNSRKKEKDEEDRNPWWLPGLVACGVAVLVGVLAYILFVGVRIALT